MSVYDQMIDAVINMPAREVQRLWGSGYNEGAGYLFSYCSPGRDDEDCSFAGDCSFERAFCGCLTQVKAYDAVAYTEELTREIRADWRLPTSMVTFLLGWDKLVPDERRTKMQPFAEWQERLDKEFNRPTPVFQLAE